VLKVLKGEARSEQRARAKANITKARTRDSMQAFSKLTHEVDGQRRIIADPPLIMLNEDVAAGAGDPRNVEDELRDPIRSYCRTLQTDRRVLLEEFEYGHAARKVVSVGSAGTRAWIVLLQGREGQDSLFLQAKEAQESVLEPFAGKSQFRNCGHRVAVAGQRSMQAASVVFLGWQRAVGVDRQVRNFYLRQLRDWKGSADVDTLSARTMTLYVRVCGATLARAHARSGDRIAIASYLVGSDAFDRAIADFSAAYADQNERDYQARVDTVGSGRLVAQRGL
jgi:hypothetical protein